MKVHVAAVENLTFIHVELVTAPSARSAYFAVRLVSAASSAIGNVQNEFCNKISPRGLQHITHTYTYTYTFTFTFTICFTICLFISLDLDGHRAPKNGHIQIDAGTIQLSIRYCTVSRYYGTSAGTGTHYNTRYT